MNNYKTYLFLINPASGAAKKNWIEFINSTKSEDQHFSFVVWDKAERREEIIEEIENSPAEVLVAVGGDGTINLLGGIAFKQNKILGIIPSGSGNGLARHLGIPLDAKKALKALSEKDYKSVDIASVNENLFLCTAGVGFDALIGKEFAKRETTGIWGYASKVLNHVFSYKPQNYKLIYDNNILQREAFLITFANASQYGNNAFIAPGASMEDGELNVCILKPFPIIAALPMAFRLFTKSIDKSKFVETIKAQEIIIHRDPGPIHLDGDPFEMNGTLNVCIKAQKIKLIC